MKKITSWKPILYQALHDLTAVRELSELLYMHGGELELNRYLRKNIENVLKLKSNKRQRYFAIVEQSIGNNNRADIAIIDLHAENDQNNIVCIIEAKAQVYVQLEQYRQLKQDIDKRQAQINNKNCEFFCVMWSKMLTNSKFRNQRFHKSIEPKYLSKYLRKSFAKVDAWADCMNQYRKAREEFKYTEVAQTKIKNIGPVYNNFNVEVHGFLYICK